MFKGLSEEGHCFHSDSKPAVRPSVDYTAFAPLSTLACLQVGEVLFLKRQSLLNPLAGNPNVSLIV